MKAFRFLPYISSPSAAFFVCTSLVAPLSGQTSTDGEEQVFELSPFEVTSSGEMGYERTDAGTATRISMDILDTPLSIDVLTEEFLRDTGRTRLVDVFDYSSSIDTNPDNVMRNDDIKIRGFKAGFVLRNGFKKYYNAPLDAIDRVEVVKGPNAVFFGQAEPGGVINYITKRPIFEPYYEGRVEVGSDEHYKIWADANVPVTDWLTTRVITSYEDSESWKEFTSIEQEFFYGGVTIKPNSRVKLNVLYEYSDTFRLGGVNNALVGNEEYFQDYYRSEGRDYGYQVDWDNADANFNTVPQSGMPTRYPWPIQQRRGPVPPETGFGGINPRWDGTITDTLVDFFDGDVPVAFREWEQPDLGNTPEFQRNVKLPFQFPVLELSSSSVGQGTDYEPGWRMLKWFESGMEEYPSRFTGPIFPNGNENFNANGNGNFHDTESHILTAEFTVSIFDWLDLRYGGNYLENSFLRVQQFNSDTDMDGFTLSPGQGFGTSRQTSISGAAVNEFENKMTIHQLDLTSTFEVGETRHTIFVSGELRRDRFTSFRHDRAPYYFENVLRPTRLFPDGTPRDFAFQEGVANWDIFNDEPDNLLRWVDIDSARPDTGTSNFAEDVAFATSYRGQFFDEKLSFLAGLRWEESRNFGFDGENIGSQKGETADDVTPMLGLNYTITDGVSLYGSYSESFLPANRPQSSGGVNFWEGDPDNPELVNQELEPLGNETGIGYEGGIKASGWNGKLSGTFTVFHLERQDIIVTDSNLIALLRQNFEEFDIDWDPGIAFGAEAPRKNSGVEVSEGIEIDLLYRPTPQWTIDLSLSWLWTAELESPDQVDFFGNTNLPIGTNEGPMPHDSLFTDEVIGTHTLANGESVEILRPLTPDEIDQALGEAAASGEPPINPVTGEEMVFLPRQHKRLAQVSDVRFSVWTVYSFAEGMLEGLTLGTGGTFQTRQRPTQSANLDYYNPGFWIFDAMARYQLPLEKHDITLQLNVNNVFERRAIDGASFAINAPREWRLTATYRF